jgi:hypothetical protein
MRREGRDFKGAAAGLGSRAVVGVRWGGKISGCQAARLTVSGAQNAIGAEGAALARTGPAVIGCSGSNLSKDKFGHAKGRVAEWRSY